MRTAEGEGGGGEKDGDGKRDWHTEEKQRAPTGTLLVLETDVDCHVVETLLGRVGAGYARALGRLLLMLLRMLLLQRAKRQQRGVRD